MVVSGGCGWNWAGMRVLIGVLFVSILPNWSRLLPVITIRSGIIIVGTIRALGQAKYHIWITYHVWFYGNAKNTSNTWFYLCRYYQNWSRMILLLLHSMRESVMLWLSRFTLGSHLGSDPVQSWFMIRC